jgi:hypothetical protein
MTRQFVIQLDNRPGELAHVARALASRGIDIEHISCAGTGTIACAFMTTGGDAETRDVLKGLGHDFIEGETIVVDVEDQPGGLGEIAQKLADAGVNILGVLEVGRREGIKEIALAVDDPVKAKQVISAAQLAGIG